MDTEAAYIIDCCSTFTPEAGWEYCYLRVPIERFAEFRSAIRNGAVVLEEYGDILFRGSGRVPPPRVAEALEGILGINHSFEEQMVQELSKRLGHDA